MRYIISSFLSFWQLELWKHDFLLEFIILKEIIRIKNPNLGKNIKLSKEKWVKWNNKKYNLYIIIVLWFVF